MIVALVVPCTNMAAYGGALERVAYKADDSRAVRTPTSAVGTVGGAAGLHRTCQ